MAYMYPKQSCSVGWQGGVIQLSSRDVWDGDDPFVKARPEFFADTPAGAVVRRTAPVVAKRSRTVEQATAAPGEKRGAKRG